MLTGKDLSNRLDVRGSGEGVATTLSTNTPLALLPTCPVDYILPPPFDIWTVHELPRPIMAIPKVSVRDSWAIFSPQEKRNILIYILGIMLYKFGLEAFNGSITSLATKRYDFEAFKAGTSSSSFEKIGLLTGLNQAFQCVGSILIAPLIKRYPTRLVLSVAIFVFGLFTAILLVVDAGTGGYIQPSTFKAAGKKSNYFYYGSYNTNGIIPIFCITGIVYGMVELIRRVIPRDIVGGDVQKLRRMDSLVHIFYEIAGTAGSFCTGLGLIPRLGNNYAFIITPIFFTAASITWFFISNLAFTARDSTLVDKPESYIKAVGLSFILFFESIWTGAKIIFSSRKFVWLFPAYSIALYAHRYLENSISPIIATRYLGESGWYQVMVAGSNLGELLGALFVFLFTNLITTPIPWLRMDALLLLVVWYLPYWYPPEGQLKYAFVVFATYIPISFGWAAGDVSLAAYIQASLARRESTTRNVSALGAVMAFLYSTYIVIYAITSPLLGKYVDRVGAANNDDVHSAMRNIAGVHFTVIGVIIMAATFIPHGAFALNPKMLFGEDLTGSVDSTDDLVDKNSEYKSMEKENHNMSDGPIKVG